MFFDYICTNINPCNVGIVKKLAKIRNKKMNLKCLDLLKSRHFLFTKKYKIIFTISENSGVTGQFNHFLLK